MKRTIVWLLALVMVTLVQAEEITSQQALQQAQRFLQERATAKNRAQKATPQLTMAKQVSGLYVFNMADNQGFVIVSNDDGVLPILGFSDSGHLDPDNMPTNMRAWLQGYADEIAWAREHKTFTVAKTSTAPAARRAGSHITAAIEPLMTTRWSQDSPFNDLCPEYASGHRCATGCVATAMAQVMRYHEWPQGATSAIPAYTTGSYGLSVSALPATTFDWDNMVDEYCRHWNGSYFVAIPSPTTAQATAVATLMQYCGSALGMDYGPESGANTDDVAKALRSYFDYNASTTQFVSRSFYTAAKWADLIYHELANRRPVVYGGTSSGGGHEFVCDGYKYESSTDFFHINWGWGGMSDDYFVLSALDPDAQGIGGSSSTDGYHYGQDAVIGIQKSTENGAVADITPNVINLTVNSMTPSSTSVPCYMPVNVTVNVTNNSVDDYDGDIYLGRKGYGLLEGGHFFIPAGETKDIVISFIPTEAGTYDLWRYLPNDIGSYYSNGVVYASVTVTSGTRNEFVPVYGYYCDANSRSQFIIPAANMDDEMANSTLNSVTFYASTLSAISWGAAEFDVYLKEVDGTTLSSLEDWSSMDKVYSGSLSIGSDGKMVITFTEPFLYEGGNLLVGINQSQSGSYSRCYWVGTTVSGASMGGYNTSISQQNFLPMTTFDYTPGVASTPKPKNVAVTPAATTASVTWTGYDHANKYNVQYRTAAKSSVIFEDGFEDGLGKWTIYTEGEARGSDGWYQADPSSLSVSAHGGSNVASAWSWNGDAYDADNWLITPQVLLGKTLKFWVFTNSGYPDSYEVLLSTTGNAISDFTVTLQEMAKAPTNGQWNEVVIDLSDYEGHQGYIAIHHESYDCNYLLIDDFGIYGVAAAAGAWQTTSTTTASTVLKGLTPQTTYELQVQGVYPAGTSDWTAVTTFTTTESALLLGDVNNDGQVTITDAVGIVNCILGNPAAGFNDAAADVNGDGSITITDAVGVVNIILKGE